MALRQISLRMAAAIALTWGCADMLAACAPALAQATPEAAKQVKPPRNKYGSPLDTLMSTRLWTDVPPAQDFVAKTRPDAKTLDYTPTTGVDPDRPKPRDKANIAALQAELEADMAKNETKARVLRPTPKRRTKP